MKKARAIMVLGTTSFAGKSLITAALCRIFADEGFHVAPFKAQNMSLNSAVTADGKEISRAQAMQALAAKIQPTVEMNPILLKPKGNGVSQVVLNGKPWGDVSAKNYYKSFVQDKGAPAVKDALEKLMGKYEVVVMEGAGSPAEINLFERDISNLAAAEMADAQAVLVADIERGGVFSSIYGTLKLLKPKHRNRVKGIIINKFRGDETLLTPGLDRIEKLVKTPVIGIVPFVEGLKLPEEDSQSLSIQRHKTADIAVIRLPRISNFTDFDPLVHDHRVNIRYIDSINELGSPDAIIIPGTKSTLDDLQWMKERGFEAIKDVAGKIPIIGICGGFQILGKKILDSGIERTEASSHRGLGLLDVETHFKKYDKTTVKVKGIVTAQRGVFKGLKNTLIEGYEIHMGETYVLNDAEPVFNIMGRPDGAIDESNMTFGTYLHGLFDSPDFREGLIRFVLARSLKRRSTAGTSVSLAYEESISRMAGIVKEKVDLSWFYDK